MFWSKFVQNNTGTLRGFSYVCQNVRNYCKERDFSFETDFPYGEMNVKEKWIDLYFQKPKEEKIKARAYIGWDLLRAIRMNKLTNLFHYMGHCDNGARNCSYCHVLLDPEVYHELPKINEDEQEHVQYQPHYRPGMSRLACRIKVTPGMNGTTIRLPRRYNVDTNGEEITEFHT